MSVRISLLMWLPATLVSVTAGAEESSSPLLEEVIVTAAHRQTHPASPPSCRCRHGAPLQLDALGSAFVVFRRPVTEPSQSVPVVTEKLLLQLTGAWAVEFKHPGGTMEQATLDDRRSWTDSAKPSVQYFSGTCTSRKTLSMPAATRGRVILDLGNVRELRCEGEH